MQVSAELKSCVGVVGAGMPSALILASGLEVVDVECLDANADLPPAVDDLVEPFVDRRVRRILSQLASSQLQALSGLIFCRDDPVGHIAHVYARELRRQGLIPDKPQFLLWNLVHRTSPSSRAFNEAQARRLETFLLQCGGTRWNDDALRRSTAQQCCRQAARRKLVAAVRHEHVTGSEAFSLWRSGGRLSPKAHADAIEAALKEASATSDAVGRRIGLVGSPVLDVAFYLALERYGQIVADPHAAGFSALPPEIDPAAGSPLSAILETEASDPLALRSLPVRRHQDAIVASCVDAKCDLVVVQLDENDDCIGWDVPSLSSSLTASGIPTLNLGFVPPEPSSLKWWIAEAMAGVRSA